MNRPDARRRPWRPGHLVALAVGVAALAGCGEGAAPIAPPEPPAGPDPVPPPVDLSREWTMSSPQAEGFDIARLDAAFDRAPAATLNIRALLAVRNGRLVREAYFGGAHADSAFDLRSVTKTVTALLVGLASDRGFLSVDDRMTAWVEHASLRPAHDAIRVRDLLTMTSGMRWTDADDFSPWVRSGEPVGYVLDQPVVAGPGERFMYNTGGSHLLAVIVQRAVEGSASDFAYRHLFHPLGIANYRWPAMQDGVVAGGVALALRPRDAAKFGQLLLQGGRSGATQLVSQGWVASQTGRLVPIKDIRAVLREAAYGYQTWHDRAGGGDGVPAFVMWGYGGQYVWVVPDRQLVVVAATHWRGTGDVSSSQAHIVAQDVVRPVVAAAKPIPR